MSNVLNRHGLAKRFMESSGYTNEVITGAGIKKIFNARNKKRTYCVHNEPEQMIKDFLLWLRRSADEPKEKNINFNLIGSWIKTYHLEKLPVDGFNSHYNSRLTPSEALIIWQLKGIRSSVQVGKAFDVSPKAIRDIWNGNSWAELISNFEERDNE